VKRHKVLNKDSDAETDSKRKERERDGERRTG
jgi:hypothetical protein